MKIYWWYLGIANPTSVNIIWRKPKFYGIQSYYSTYFSHILEQHTMVQLDYWDNFHLNCITLSNFFIIHYFNIYSLPTYLSKQIFIEITVFLFPKQWKLIARECERECYNYNICWSSYIIYLLYEFDNIISAYRPIVGSLNDWLEKSSYLLLTLQTIVFLFIFN